MAKRKIPEWLVNIRSGALFLLICNTVFTYFFKYSHNSVIPLDFTIYNVGNLYNLIAGIFSATGILFLFILNREIRLTRFIFAISSAIFSLLIIALILNSVELPGFKSYVLGYPAKKIVVALFLSANGFLQIYLIIFVWQKLLKLNDNLIIRSTYLSVIVIITMMIFTFFFTLNFNDKKPGKNEKFDVAVILGAAVWSNNKPSPVFAGRINEGAELYKSGEVKKLQVTGGNAPGEISEAEAAREMLIELGVDEQDILLEQQTATTSEQIKFIRENLQIPGKTDSVIIISDKFHLARVMEICRFYRVNARPVSTGKNLRWEKYLYYHLRESIGLLLFWLYAI